MTGLSILTHSIRLVFGNLGQAIRVFGIPYVLLVALQFIPNPDDTSLGGGWFASILFFFLILLAAIFLFSWMAVAWHRYILLGEATSGILPLFRRDQWASYIRRSLVLTLCTFMISAVVGMAWYFLGSYAPPWLAVIIGFVAIIALLVTSYRLCVMLPASAVGHKMSLGDAWSATRGYNATIVAVVFLSTIAAVLLTGGAALFVGMPALSIAWLTLTGWITTVVGVTILTTLYGHIVEGRPIGGSASSDLAEA